MNIKESGEQFCYLPQPILINIIEGAEVFAVNIQYGDYLTIPDNRYYNLRTGGAAAGNMPRKFLNIFMVKPCGVQDVDFHFLNQYHVLSLSGFWGVTLPKPLVDFRHEAIRACSITEV
jgi:hypothetical protein